MSFTRERVVTAVRPVLFASAAVITVALIAVLDYATGPSLSMAFFYIIPVVAVTAVVGRRSGYAVMAASGVAAVVSDVILPPHFSQAIKKRILVAQSLYAFGALLCLFDNAWSIGFIVLVQLNYAIAPRFRSRRMN